MEDKFNDILERDENIIQVFKPNKKRYWKGIIFPFAIPLFWIHILVLLLISLFTLPIWLAKAYKNSYFTYTNKRLIIRSGMFGVSFKSLEYKDITSTSVSVGFLDKKTNTGTITFMSPSAHGTPMVFSAIENPYEVLKDIKEYINAVNDNQK